MENDAQTAIQPKLHIEHDWVRVDCYHPGARPGVTVYISLVIISVNKANRMLRITEK